jgi:hypothetical protein
MTVQLDRLEPSLSRYLITYVDAPRNAVAVRRRPSSRRRAAAAASVGAAALVLAGAIAAGAFRPAVQARPAGDCGHGAVPGEFRLGPGNQQPPGVVVPADRLAHPVAEQVPGEFRLGPGLAEPPGVVVPAD